MSEKRTTRVYAMNVAAMWMLAIAVLATGVLLGLGLLKLAAAHADLERACLEGGGIEYLAPPDTGSRDDQTSEAAVGTCYHPD